jgi:enoyl-CoA hydratase/carnithine racemase
MSVPLPSSLRVALQDGVAVLRICRAEKRNSLDDATIRGLHDFFDNLPEGTRAVVIHGEGDHFSAGLDLSTLRTRSVEEGVAHSRRWHRAFERIEFGDVPVVCALHGAVVGGGLELAASTHIRVAERGAYYALPEGSRGIYVGGGASVRVSRLSAPTG